MLGGQGVLEHWAKAIGIDCPCKFIAKIPLILINNPYYFPKVTYDSVTRLYDVLAEFPLVDYFRSCLQNDLLSFVILDDKNEQDTIGIVKDYFSIDGGEVYNLSFGEIRSEDFEGNKDSNFVLVFNIELSQGRLKPFLQYMGKGEHQVTGRVGNEDLSAFIDAFKDEDGEKGE